MRRIEQRGSRATFWFVPNVTLDADGSLAIPATSIWAGNVRYALAAYSGAVGTGPFCLLVGADESGGAVYQLDLTPGAIPGRAPTPLGGNVGAPCVAWRETEGADIQVLRSVSGA